MPAANTDKFRKAAPNFSTILAEGGCTNTDEEIACSDLSSLPTDTAVDLTIDKTDANDAFTPAKKEVITGVISGNNIISSLRGQEGTAQEHAGGAKVENEFTAKTWNDLIDGILVSLNQNGTLKDAIVATAKIADAAITAAKLALDIRAGWNDFTALTRVSDVTATLDGDWTDRIPVGGAPMRWKSNGAYRYNWIVARSYSAGTGKTTITIPSGYITTESPNDSCFKENDTITVPQYSLFDRPVGFPANSNTFGPLGASCAKVTANQAGITTYTDLNNLTITVYVPSGKRILLTGYAGILSSVNGDNALLGIYEGATRQSYAQVPCNTTDEIQATTMAVITPTAGLHTYNLKAARSTGTGSLTMYAGSTNPAFIRADII